MARIFITGSSDGLGQLAAERLLKEGHTVVLHARNELRAKDALRKNPHAEAVLIGDLSNAAETKRLANQANELGTFDSVIHNAGVYQATPQELFAVNTVAPYLLTCLINRPSRLIYLSSGMHLHGHAHLEYWPNRIDRHSYSDTKVHVLLMTLAIARLWPSVYSNAVDPGWVPTKMGGSSAPDDLQKGFETQAWLATSNEPSARVSGHYFYHKRVKPHLAAANDVQLQDAFLRGLSTLTGVSLPLPLK